MNDGAPIKTLEHLIEQVIDSAAGDFLVEFKLLPGNNIKVFVDGDNGVPIDKLVQYNRVLYKKIEEIGLFPGGDFALEVSSPGLERGLYKRGDYERFAGNLVKIKTRNPIGGQRNFRGRLLGIEGDEVSIEDRTSGRVIIPFDSVSKANLEMDFEQELRRAKANWHENNDGPRCEMRATTTE